MKHTLPLSFLIVSTLLAYTGCTQKPSVQEEILIPESIDIPIHTTENTPVKEISHPQTTGTSYHLRSIQGKTIDIIEGKTGFTFPQYEDKIVILEIFGKECKYCMEELPVISEIRRKYGEKVQVIAIQAEEPMSTSEYLTLKENFNMSYPIIERDVALNLLYSLRDIYGWTSVLPYVQVIKDGITQYQFPGQTSPKELKDALSELTGY